MHSNLRCRISWRASHKAEARRSAAHLNLVFDRVQRMRGGAPRSSLQKAAPILWIDRRHFRFWPNWDVGHSAYSGHCRRVSALKGMR